MTLQIKGRIEVSSWHPAPWKLGEMLAANGGVRSTLLGLADEVATEAQANLNALGSTPPSSAIYPSYRGRRWSARATEVAKQVKVKDASKVFPLKTGRLRQARETRVALVVANHPYSFPYEFGGMGIKSIAFMRKATSVVAARRQGVRYDKNKGKAKGQI